MAEILLCRTTIRRVLKGAWGLLLCVMLPALIACGEEMDSAVEPRPATHFTLLSPTESGIEFQNRIVENDTLNYMTYMHVYEGAGVAVLDVNNDGLGDVYFTANYGPNALYINRGNLKFEDITASSGTAGGFPSWTTGVTIVDINQDGYSDIYVCRSGWFENPAHRRNLLFVNNGDETFTERAADYGLDDKAHSTQATFFDYDRDGDLDMYLVNHPIDFSLTRKYADLDKIMAEPERWRKLGGHDKLYRNNGDGTFNDVSDEAGIFDIGFGLNVIAGDLNEDGWDDLYVSNDFLYPDVLYYNNGDGTFRDATKEALKHVSMFGMGSDIGDFNNDGLPDVVVLDMVSEDHFRSKVNMAPMSSEQFWDLVNTGHHYQYMLNTLQMNTGDGQFSEVSQLAGISKTDWSWSPLLADFDNDGMRDLFITNGILRDVSDNDFQREQFKIRDHLTTKRLLEIMPSTKVSNYMYRNVGHLKFESVTDQWGMNIPGFSNGAAYCDFDGDGDLDLVINNVNEPGQIYRNNEQYHKRNNWLRIRFEGSAHNRDGLGAKVWLQDEGQQWYQQHTRTRGYMSASENYLHFGLGDNPKIDTLIVVWPDGQTQTRLAVTTDQVLTLKYGDSQMADPRAVEKTFLFSERTPSGVPFTHVENEHDDFAREVLLPHRMSREGPALATGDVNGDGLEDVYIGGAAGHAGALLLRSQDGGFVPHSSQPWNADADAEDVGALLFDSDGDGDLDLYVVSGGYAFADGSQELQDRLYINHGTHFVLAPRFLPDLRTIGSCVDAADYDDDGDLDLFVGGRVKSGHYPMATRSYLLNNDGGVFTDVTADVVRDLMAPGMVADALWSDYDADGDPDLMVVGEWMPISVYQNNGNGRFTNMTTNFHLQNTTGWWNTIAMGDFDGDGDFDYIAGNLGLNTKYSASPEKPLIIYMSDFDENGTPDIVLAKPKGDKELPIRGRECSSDQMPFIAEDFPTFRSFANASIKDIYGQESLDAALQYRAMTFSSAYIENIGGALQLQELPPEVQVGPVRSIVVHDFNGDNFLDAALVGNNYGAEVETVRYDAMTGLLLLGDGTGRFNVVPSRSSGLRVQADARHAALLHGTETLAPLLFVAVNSSQPRLFELNSQKSASLKDGEPIVSGDHPSGTR